MYIPLNLATSIFGMNLQQLNSNGRPLQDFISTATVALFVTIVTWFLVEQANIYRRWRRARQSPRPLGNDGLRYSLVERIAMIVWLCQNGHITWMMKWGAHWRILLNSRQRFRFYPSEEQTYSFSDYVAKYSEPMENWKPATGQHYFWDDDALRIGLVGGIRARR